MKKSKLLQNSKDMFSKSFNPSKCKTSLRLAGSRLKLLRNKKEVQVKQMKREISQLLESGQEQTARIRVEHVIREDKMMAAYDLIEIYCELIIARLSIIESQKICPIDLKEAIASVIFASPRCGDVPELVDVKKHFTAKYGKEFITAAIELRPACGVSRMVVEKLSAIAPDGQAKLKVLQAIAEEHNVKWDSFEDKYAVPPSDLPSGPGTFGNVSEISVESSRSKSPYVQDPRSNYKNGSPLDLPQQDPTSSHRTEKLASVQTTSFSRAFQPEERPPGHERSELFHGDSNTIPMDRHQWTMEFKDATSAAQAAAESAERASMAARAAAILSTRDSMMRQYSIGSNKSDDYVPNEGPESNTHSKSTSKQFYEDFVNRSPSAHSSFQNERIDSIKEKYGNFRKNSSKSKQSIHDDNQIVDRHFQKNSLNGDYSKGELSTKKPSFKNETENYDDGHSRYDSSVVFDEADSDSDDHRFDVGQTYDDHESDSHLPLPVKKPTEHIPVYRDSWTLESISSKNANLTTPQFLTRIRKNSSSAFAERPKYVNGSSEQNKFMHVTFDDSDGPISESDETLSEHNNDRQSVGSSFKEKVYSESSKKQLSLSSEEELRSKDMYRRRNQQKYSDAESSENFGGSGFKSTQVESNDSTGIFSPESGEGLNLGKLTGGFRHKGYNHPPYLKNQLDGSLPLKEKTVVHPAVEIPRKSSMLDYKKNTRTPELHFHSDSDSSEEEVYLHKDSGRKQELHGHHNGKEVENKLSIGVPSSIFSSDDSDLDNDAPNESFSKKNHLQRGISRRTKASPSTVGKPQMNSKTLNSNVVDMVRKPSFEKGSESPNRNSNVASKPAKSNFWGPPEHVNSSKVTSTMTQEFKTSWKLASAVKEPSITQKKAEAFFGGENSKAATNNKSSLNKDDSIKKVSHVHSKLPDYDTLVQSLRLNRS